MPKPQTFKFPVTTQKELVESTPLVRLQFCGYLDYPARNTGLGCGIYIIHERERNSDTLGELLYIGETADYWGRHIRHHVNFREACQPG
jgi:hypothetical protein